MATLSFDELRPLAECRWARFALNEVAHESVTLSYDYGDPALHVVHHNDGSFAFGSSGRGGPISFSLVTMDAQIALRWLILNASFPYRYARAYLQFSIPHRTSQIREGYALHRLTRTLSTLRAPDGELLPMKMSDDLVHDVSQCVRYSHIHDIEVHDLVDSVTNANGEPSLSQFLAP